MPQATLLTTTVFACLVVALGCGDREVEESVLPRTTTIRTPTPPYQPADPAPIPAAEPASPKPGISAPPTEKSLDAPTRSPEPPAAPIRPPSRYV